MKFSINRILSLVIILAVLGFGITVFIIYTARTGQGKAFVNTGQHFSLLNIILSFILIAVSVISIIILRQIKSANKRQQLQEQKFSALLDAAPDATIIVNEAGIIEMVNKQTGNLFGYTPAEIIGQPVEILIPAELRNKHHHHRADFVKAARLRTIGAGLELSAVKKNGLKFPVEISLSPIQTEQGMLVSASVRDISNRKSEEDKLRKSETNFQLLVSSVKDYAIFLLDITGKVASWNNGAEIIKGYRAEEIIGKPMDIFYTAEEIEKGEPQRNLKIARENGHYETEGWRLRKNGSSFYANVVLTSLFDNEGNLYGYVKLTKDITEKRKAEEHIRFLATIAGNIQDPVIASDNNFCLSSWNEAAEKLFEWKSEEVIGKSTREVLKIIYPYDTREQILHSFTEKGYWQGEVIYHTKSGKPLNILATASHLKDDNENVTGILVLAKDITERIKAEKQLKEFEYFFNNSNDLSCIANTEGYFEILNPGFNKILGYSESELSKNPFIDFVHPDDIAATLEAYGQLKSGATVIHFINRYRKKDGGYLWFEWNATPNPLTGKLYCIARDITGRKKAEDALSKLNEELEQRVKERTAEIEKNEKRFRALIENNYDVISLMDEQFNVFYRSPSAVRITGWTDKEMLHLNGTQKIHPDDLEYARAIVQELIANPGKSINTLFRNQHKDGHYLWMEGTVVNLLNEESIKAIVFNFRDITKRKELENLLHKANVLARIGGWEVDLVKGTVYWTDITREIHETENSYVPDLATGIIFYKEGKGRDLITQKVKEAIELGKPWDVELQIVTAKNNERWIRTIGETEFVNGKCVRIYGSFQDIDERKKAEQALLRSEARARRIFESDMIGFLFWSEKGQILEANDHFLRMTGYTREDLEKGLVNWAAMTPLEYANLDIIALEQITGTGICKPFEKEYVRKDGSRFPIILGAAALGENFDGVGVCYVMDITERKQTEESMKLAEANYREIFDKASDAIYVHEIDTGKVIEVNQKAADITGFSKKEITTGSLEEFITDNPEYTIQHAVTYLQKAAAGEPQLFDWLSRKKDGSHSWLEVNLKKASIAGEERILAFFREINDRKKAQLEVQKLNEELEQKVIRRTEQLRKTNEELEAFSYSVSHDLRAPLRGIIGFTNILEEDYGNKLDDEAKRITAVIKTNTIRMGSLIDDLLTFSRMGRQEMLKAPVDTGAMVQEILNEMKKTVNNGDLQWLVGPLPVVNADIATLRQVWINFLSNAIKYSSNNKHPQIEIGHYIKEKQHIFFVKDNGVGFNNEYRDKLFRVFQRLHSPEEFEGTGIGLALAGKIISKHGGEVWAEGEVNKGANFYFSLPVI